MENYLDCYAQCWYKVKLVACSVPQRLQLWLLLFDVFINNLDNRRECAFSKVMDDTKLMNWSTGLLFRDTLTVWRNELTENLGNRSSMKEDDRGKFTCFPNGRKEKFQVSISLLDGTVVYRILQCLKKKVMMCDLTWSQEGVLHFTVVVSTVVWGSSSSSRICNYTEEQTAEKHHRNLGLISLVTGREIGRNSKSTEVLYAVFSFLQYKIIICIPAELSCFLHTFQFTVNEKVILQMAVSQYSLSAD